MKFGTRARLNVEMFEVSLSLIGPKVKIISPKIRFHKDNHEFGRSLLYGLPLFGQPILLCYYNLSNRVKEAIVTINFRNKNPMWISVSIMNLPNLFVW